MKVVANMPRSLRWFVINLIYNCMIVAIHQPEFFPWLGFFHKMYLSDVFVFLDNVQFEKNNWQNRNRIMLSGKPGWLTMPIKKHSLNTKIKDIEIDWQSSNVVKDHLNSIRFNYCKCKFFNELFPFMEGLYLKQPKYLADFNLEFIKFISQKLGIDKKFILASELKLPVDLKGGTEVTLDIVKKMKGDIYLSGSGAKDYLIQERYQEEKILLKFQEFHHPEYFQRGIVSFVSNLSILDLYLNHGPESVTIIKSTN